MATEYNTAHKFSPGKQLGQLKVAGARLAQNNHERVLSPEHHQTQKACSKKESRHESRRRRRQLFDYYETETGSDRVVWVAEQRQQQQVVPSYLTNTTTIKRRRRSESGSRTRELGGGGGSINLWSHQQELIYGNDLAPASQQQQQQRRQQQHITQSPLLLSHPIASNCYENLKNSRQLLRENLRICNNRIRKQQQQHPLRSRHHSLILLAYIVLFSVAIFHQIQPTSLKSIEEQTSNSLNKEQKVKISDDQQYATLSPLSTTTTTNESTTLNSSGFFTKLKSAFSWATSPPSSSILTTSTTPLTTTASESIATTTTVEPKQDESEDNDSSSKHDDDDAEGCEGISADESATAKNITENQRLVNLQTCLQGKMRRSLMSATRSSMEIFEKLSLTGGCSSSLLNLMTSLGGIKSFAFKFLDASAKIPNGVMSGLLSDYGDFDQCLSIRSNPSVVVENEAEEGAYSGKYCLMNVKLNYHVTLAKNETVPDGIIPDGVLWDKLMRNYWISNSSKGFQVGMCVPSRCTNDDLDQIYKHVAASYNIVGNIISCQDSLDLKIQYQPDLIQRIIIYTFRCLVILTILGTIIDRYYPELAIVERIGDACSKTTTNLSRDSNDTTVSKNWRTFMRKNHLRTDQWDCPTNTNSTQSSDGSTVNSSKRTISTERISVGQSTMDGQVVDCIMVAPVGDSASHDSANIGSTIDNGSATTDKLCRQLTVKIQPDDYLQEQDRDTSLSQLSGLRLFVIFWVTIGHSFLYPSANNYQHYRSIINMNITRDSVWFATTNFTLGIDMLLYMTGLVFVYKLAHLSPRTYELGNGLSMKFNLDKSGIIRLMSKKILRFWPTYVTVIALAIVVPLLSDGPTWPEMVSKRIGGSCRQNWWLNLLFINNIFLNESDICLPSSWFVSILMQLFLIGSIIIVLVRRSSLKVALLVLTILLLGSSSVSFCFAYFLHLRAPVIRMDESFVMEMDDNIFRLYTNIFNNLGPFLVGMAGGFLLVSTQISNNSVRIRRQVNHSKQSSSTSPNNDKEHWLLAKFKRQLYLASIAIIVLVIAVLVLSSVFHQEYSRLWSSIYWSLHRVGWAIVTGYIIHNCATGRWQLLNDFLSLSTFIPLSRLIFIAYLVYPIFVHVHSGHVRDGLHISIYNMLNIYITRWAMTFTTALLIHLLVELPFCSIEEIYLKKWVQKLHNSPKNKDSSKLHPLLAVAPIVSLHFNDTTKPQEEPTNQDNNTTNVEINTK